MVDITERSAKWANNPEPLKQTLSGNIILDADIGEMAWLWHTNEESSKWLMYEGETMEVKE